MAQFKPETISIIGGNGQMGSLFAKEFQKAGCDVVIADVSTKVTNKEAASRGDIVIVSVPIRKTQEVIREISPFLKKDAMLTDFTSIKVKPIETMAENFQGEIIGGHPLFGPTTGLEKQNFILCPYREGKFYNWYKDFLTSLKINIIEIDCKEHDKNMAVIQCLIHFSNLALANTLKELNYNLDFAKKLSSPVYMLRIFGMGRILAQDESLYSDIQIENPFSEQMVSAYKKSVSDILDNISKGEKEEFEKKFIESRDYFGKICEESMDVTDRLIKEMSKNE